MLLSRTKYPNYDYGENVVGGRCQLAAKQYVKMWYDKIENYRFGGDICPSPETGNS